MVSSIENFVHKIFLLSILVSNLFTGFWDITEDPPEIGLFFRDQEYDLDIPIYLKLNTKKTLTNFTLDLFDCRGKLI